MISNKLIGQITLVNSDRNYTDRDIQIIEKFAVVYALAIEQKKVESELQQNEAFLSSIIKNLPIGIATYDSSGKCVSTNEAHADIVGASVDELLEQNFRKIGSWKKHGLLQAAEEALSSNEIRKLDTVFLTSFGKQAWLDYYIVPFISRNDNLLLLIISDITKRKEAEAALQQNEELLSSIIDNSPIGVALEDTEGNLLRCNPALIQMLGYSYDELKERKLRNLTHPDDKEINNETVQKVINKELPVAVVEKRYIKQDGSFIPVHLTVWEVFDVEGKPRYFIGTIEDVTEQLQARKRIEELNESLKIINDILRHDLGNNISIIEGSLGAFLDIRDDAFLEMTKYAVDKSFDLIQKMQDLEGLLVEEKELEEIDVRKIVEKVIIGYPTASVSFKIEGNGIIIANNAIFSVMDNLIGNAIKHGKADEIIVSIDPCDNYCMIEVADNGKGIPEKYKKKLFRQGFKYGKTAGSGLGLYIVKKTLERYSGEVTIKDNDPKGTIPVND